MSTEIVKVSYEGNNTMFVPAMEVPYPAPVRDVTRIVLNGFTTNGNSGRRVFVPERTCCWAYHVPKRLYVCSECGCVKPDVRNRQYRMRYCPNCGARIEEEDE